MYLQKNFSYVSLQFSLEVLNKGKTFISTK